MRRVLKSQKVASCTISSNWFPHKFSQSESIYTCLALTGKEEKYRTHKWSIISIYYFATLILSTCLVTCYKSLEIRCQWAARETTAMVSFLCKLNLLLLFTKKNMCCTEGMSCFKMSITQRLLCPLGLQFFCHSTQILLCKTAFKRWMWQTGSLTWQRIPEVLSKPAEVECDVATSAGHAGKARFSQISCSHLCFFVTRKLGQGNVKTARGESST